MNDIVWVVSYGEPYEGMGISRILKTRELAKQYVEKVLSNKNKSFVCKEDCDDLIMYYFNNYFDSENINIKNAEYYCIEPLKVEGSIDD